MAAAFYDCGSGNFRVIVDDSLALGADWPLCSGYLSQIKFGSATGAEFIVGLHIIQEYHGMMDFQNVPLMIGPHLVTSNTMK